LAGEHPGNPRGTPVVIKKRPPPAAQPPRAPVPAVPPAAPAAPPPVPPAPSPGAGVPPPPEAPPERVEADVSTRNVAVTSGFSGTEIIIFGTVANSRQVSAESGFYDVAVVVEGQGAPSIVRLKSNMGGLWVNAQSVRFDNLPLYSAIASTRPLDEIAEPRVLLLNGVGFGRERMVAGRGSSRVSAEALEDYKSAVMRLKQQDGLYVRNDYGVAFIGRSLFRASIKLPANIPVGPLQGRVYLFRDGKLLASNSANLMLEREGLERLIYDYAHEHPVWYGLAAVLLAASAGLAASVVFQRASG
jgi:uncharacterized protein (TIGR02186 family)